MCAIILQVPYQKKARYKWGMWCAPFYRYNTGKGVWGAYKTWGRVSWSLIINTISIQRHLQHHHHLRFSFRSSPSLPSTLFSPSFTYTHLSFPDQHSTSSSPDAHFPSSNTSPTISPSRLNHLSLHQHSSFSTHFLLPNDPPFSQPPTLILPLHSSLPSHTPDSPFSPC